jgi:hypothetical protein
MGSVIAIVATDAPLLPHQLKRLARRVPLALAAGQLARLALGKVVRQLDHVEQAGDPPGAQWTCPDATPCRRGPGSAGPTCLGSRGRFPMPRSRTWTIGCLLEAACLPKDTAQHAFDD